MNLQIFLLSSCLCYLVTSMHIPEDIEILEGYEFSLPYNEGMPEELISQNSLHRNKLRIVRSPTFYNGFNKVIRQHGSGIIDPYDDEQYYQEIREKRQNTEFQNKKRHRKRRSLEEEIKIEKNETQKIMDKEEELPLAEKHYMESDNYREPRAMDGWMKRSFNSDYAKVQEEEEALAEASINEGIKARAPRVNFVTQGKKSVETAETRERPTVAKPTEAYRRPYDGYSSGHMYNEYSQPLPRAYDAYSRRYDRYFHRYDPRDAYDYYNPYDNYETRRRYENFDGYMPRTPNSFYYYPGGQYDLPEPRDRDYYGSNGAASSRYNDINGPPLAPPPMNRNRRIIYYATLPDVARTSPNVDLRYRSYKTASDRYDPSYNSYTSNTDNAYRSNRSPRDYVRKSNPVTTTPERPKETKEYNANPVRIASSLKVNDQRSSPLEHRLYPESKNARSDQNIRPSFQDGVEERDHTYFSRNH